MSTLNECAIAGLVLTACVLNVMQNDGWSKPYCPESLCIKYRAFDSQQFCRIYNFKASYKRANPIQVIFVLPQKDGCVIALNSITQSESKQSRRKYDLIKVKLSNFHRKQ